MEGRLPPRYEVIRPLGKGGMGDVLLARDSRLGREVAVKILSDRASHDPAIRERFLREAATAAALSGHPNVVAVHDAGEWDGRPYLVMEYLAGGSVEERLGAGIDPARAIAWLEQAADALDAAHERGIVHRDVKPANLLLDGRDRVRVADFGIARGAADEALTATGDVLGTAGYLAPEQAAGRPAGPASDRYALAVVAFELLAGRRPSEPGPPLAPSLEATFARALASDPRRRHPTAAAFVRELAPAPPPTARLPAYRRERRAGRLRRTVRAVTALAAAGSIAAVSALAAHVLTVESARPAAAPSRPSTCTVSPPENDANIVATGIRAEAFCRSLTRRLSGDRYWAYRAGRALYAPDHGTAELSLVCRFRSGRIRVAVLDAGSQSIGRDVCWRHLTGRWDESSVA